ncbi:unnamed protein product, partial [Closterium sp. NIES-54]
MAPPRAAPHHGSRPDAQVTRLLHPASIKQPVHVETLLSWQLHVLAASCPGSFMSWLLCIHVLAVIRLPLTPPFPPPYSTGCPFHLLFSLLRAHLPQHAQCPTSRRSKLPAFLHRLLQLPLLRAVVSRTHTGVEEEGWAGKGEVNSEQEGQELLASAWSVADEAGLNRAELERAVTGAGAAEAAAAHMAQHCGGSPGSSVIITNGRLLAPQHRFVAADFALLEEVESKRVKAALSVLQDLPSWPHLPPDLPLSDHVSGMAMVVASALSSAERASGDYVQFARLTASPSIGIIHSNESALLHIDGVIDPLSAEAQQVTPLLLLLHEWFNPSMRVFMNPLVRALPAPPPPPACHDLVPCAVLPMVCRPYCGSIDVQTPMVCRPYCGSIDVQTPMVCRPYCGSIDVQTPMVCRPYCGSIDVQTPMVCRPYCGSIDVQTPMVCCPYCGSIDSQTQNSCVPPPLQIRFVAPIPSPLSSHALHVCQSSMSEFPLKNFYRYAAPHK